MHSRRSLVSVLITAVTLIALSSAADATYYAVTAKNRQFCCTNPAAFLYGQPGKKSGNQPTVKGLVTQMGTGTPSIKVGKSQVVNFFTKFSWYVGGMTPPAAGFKYIKGTASAVNGTGTLKKSGAYGNFSFCPKAKGPGVGACANPALATPVYFNGRIAVKQGPHKFGGTLQILAGKGGVGGSKDTVWRWIGPSSMYPAAKVKLPIHSDVVGAMTPAKQRTDPADTKLLTHTAASKVVTFKSFPSAMLWENGAGPFTTGKLYLQATMGGTPSARSVVISGYDKRSPMGAGNIQLVSGILFNVYKNSKPGSVPIAWKLNVNLPEPSPSLGLAAGALGLLLVGLFGGRRWR